MNFTFFRFSLMGDVENYQDSGNCVQNVSIIVHKPVDDCQLDGEMLRRQTLRVLALYVTRI
jgi:hypothetical protein